MNLFERFESLIYKDPNSGCWIWLGSERSGDYGAYSFNNKLFLAHRFSYLLYNGDITGGRMVCHSCDNRSCVNPNHLWLGSAKDNQHDCKLKGRYSHGAHRPASKLSEEDILKIRKDGRLLKEIAKDYGVAISTISLAKRKESWIHVEDHFEKLEEDLKD